MIVELEKGTIRELFRRSVALYGKLPALALVGQKPESFFRVDERVRALAADLAARGVGKGDRVALLGENSPNWVVAYLAIMHLGAVAVPILPGFAETDARHILRHSEACALFVSDKQRVKIEDARGAVVPNVYSLETLTCPEPASPRRSLLAKTLRLVRGEPKRPPRVEDPRGPDEDDLAAIIYTSGTTGNSKGVMLTHRNIVFDAVHSIERFPIDSGDRFLSILPLAHLFEATGGMLCPLAVGASIHYLQGLPTPQKLLGAMAECRPTALLMVPLVIEKIFRKRVLPPLQANAVVRGLYRLGPTRRALHWVAGRKLMSAFGGSLRFLMVGGAALNEETETFLRDAGIVYSTGYGMTETAPILTINPFGKVRLGSCGKPIPGIELRIDAPDPASGVGEIVVRGANVMGGYYKNPEATAEAFLTGGWLRTGDLGRFDEDGYLYIKGRSKNVVVGPSGENIYPEVVEQQLLASPYVQEVVVLPVEGKLVAKVYLDYDVLDQEFARGKLGPAEAEKLTERVLEQIRVEANAALPSFSRLQRIVEHPQPFEKTPTSKVKRHLYTTPGAPLGR